MSYDKKYKKKKEIKIWEPLLTWIPMGLMIGFVPLIVKGAAYNPGLYDYDFAGTSTNKLDFFLYNKQVAIIILGVVLLIMLLAYQYRTMIKYKYAKGKQQRTIPLILWITMGVFTLESLISTFASVKPDFSWKGGYEQFESIWVLLTYVLLLFISYCMVWEKENEKLSQVLLFSAGILGLISLSQFIGKDFFASTIGKGLITYGMTNIDSGTLSFNFGKGVVYATLYNPNYVGSYVCLVFPVIVGMLIWDKKIWKKIVALFVAALLVVALIGSGSTTGIISLTVALLVGVLIFLLRIFDAKKKKVVGAAALLVILVGIICCRSQFTNVIHSIFDSGKDNYVLQSIQTSKDGIDVEYNGKSIHLTYSYVDTFEVSAQDQDGNELEILADTSQYIFSDSALEGLSIVYGTLEDGTNVMAMKENDHTWTFSNTVKEDGVYYYHNVYGKWDTIQPPKKALFATDPEFADHRGFLWSRSIPLLKDSLLVGSGPDTFVLQYPNDDYVGLSNNSYTGSIVTRPHNMYLQIAIQLGVPALLAFLILYIWYVIQTCKNIIKKKTGMCALVILIGTIAYMIAGLANDSTIGVAPIFWVMFGIGIAQNYVNKDKEKNSPKNPS